MPTFHDDPLNYYFQKIAYKSKSERLTYWYFATLIARRLYNSIFIGSLLNIAMSQPNLLLIYSLKFHNLETSFWYIPINCNYIN